MNRKDAFLFSEGRIRSFSQEGGGPNHNVGDLVWMASMAWMAKNNVLDLKNKFKIKGTFRRPANSEGWPF